MTLDKVRRGDLIKIICIIDDSVKEHALRMGIDNGTIMTCAEVIPAGPIVLSKNKQEIAIGRDLARNIDIELLTGVSKAMSVSAKWKSEMC